MKNILKRNIFLIAILTMLSLTACNEGELAFEVVESPVLAVFETVDTGLPSVLSYKATFYELDKSGILDKNIGIDSIPLTGLSISVFVNESDLVADYATDGSGQVLFEKPMSELNGARRLEWVGEHKAIPFRIYKNF